MDYVQKKPQPKFSVVVHTDAYQKLINDTLGDPKVAKRFVADISAVVANNPSLAKCEAGSIISAGLMAQSLNFSMSPSIGQAYLVPFKTRDGHKAQFQVGYKGFIQLAMRSGQFKKIDCKPVHEGEYQGQDENGDDIVKFANHEFDAKPVVGYRAYFVLLNGFEKSLYMTVEQVKAHATRYSQAYRSETNSPWLTNFDEMAMKTVIKQLISKWAPLSIDFQRAIEADQAVINSDMTPQYVDNEPEPEELGKSTVTNSILPPADDNGEVAPEEPIKDPSAVDDEDQPF